MIRLALLLLVPACPSVSVPETTSASGVVIGEREGFGYLLTSAHVVPLDGVVLRFTSRERYPAPAWTVAYPTVRVMARWPDPDLALVRFQIPQGRTLPRLQLAPIGERPRQFPRDVWSLGLGKADVASPQGDHLLAKMFIRRPNDGKAFFWQTATPPEFGRSGGPLLDGRGRLIGICTARRDDRGYYTHLDEIHAALKQDGYGWLIPRD